MTKKKPSRGRPFQPGRSGNPGGRPAGLAPFRLICRGYTREALGVLVGIMRDEKESASARVRAVSELFDRAWGRPVQELQVEGAMVQFAPEGRDWPKSREALFELGRKLAFILHSTAHDNERQAARRHG